MGKNAKKQPAKVAAKKVAPKKATIKKAPKKHASKGASDPVIDITWSVKTRVLVSAVLAVIVFAAIFYTLQTR